MYDQNCHLQKLLAQYEQVPYEPNNYYQPVGVAEVAPYGRESYNAPEVPYYGAYKEEPRSAILDMNSAYATDPYPSHPVSYSRFSQPDRPDDRAIQGKLKTESYSPMPSLEGGRR